MPTWASHGEAGERTEYYEVRDVSPPPKNLGVHPLPTNTQCGAVVTVIPRTEAEQRRTDDPWEGWGVEDAVEENEEETRGAPDAADDDAEAAAYVVQSVTYRYKLERGRYVRDGKRLDVQPQGRFFAQLMLDRCLR